MKCPGHYLEKPSSTIRPTAFNCEWMRYSVVKLQWYCTTVSTGAVKTELVLHWTQNFRNWSALLLPSVRWIMEVYNYFILHWVQVNNVLLKQFHLQDSKLWMYRLSTNRKLRLKQCMNLDPVLWTMDVMNQFRRATKFEEEDDWRPLRRSWGSESSILWISTSILCSQSECQVVIREALYIEVEKWWSPGKNKSSALVVVQLKWHSLFLTQLFVISIACEFALTLVIRWKSVKPESVRVTVFERVKLKNALKETGSPPSVTFVQAVQTCHSW